MTGRERMQRLRARKKSGAVWIEAEMHPGAIQGLIEFGWITPEQASDKNAVTLAIGNMIQAAFRAGLRPN